MSSLSPDVSIEDVMEDIQLQHVLLQSLEEEQPDAIDEKEEIRDEIKRLEKELADLRKKRFQNIFDRQQPFVRESTPSNSLSRAQLDGGYDLDPLGSPRLPIRQRLSAMSPPSEPPRRKDSARFSPAPRPSKKRRYQDADPEEDVEPSTKRSATPYPRDSRSPSPSGLPTEREFEGFPLGSPEDSDAADDLRELLGFDSRDAFRELQDEQRKAEEWLEERKEQERRDAEYARMLQEGLYDAPRRGSTTSASSLGYSEFPSGSLPDSSNRLDTAQKDRLPHSNEPGPLNSYSGDAYRSTFAQPFNGKRGETSKHPDSISLLDSSDSEVAEITALDFENNVGHPPDSKQASTSGRAVYPSAYPWMDNTSSSYLSKGGIPGPSSAHSWSPSGVLQGAMDKFNSRGLLKTAGRSLWGGLADPVSYLHAFNEYQNLQPYRPLDYSKDLDDTAGDPRKTREEIKQLLETIRPDLELSKQSREGTPEALEVTLMEHQKVGLTWMKSMEESDQKGGILADDMGLGKTIQALALIVARPSTDPERKTTLIIAPVSLMHQWKREIHKSLKPGKHQRSVYVLHGDRRGVRFKTLKSYDVVLTTFGTMASELKRKEHWDELEKKGARDHAVAQAIALPILGPSSKWHRVIIDEAQCIKNRNTKAALACCRIDATYRWCMSGTPMMNSVTELHSLLKFLRIRPYCSLEKFNTDFTRPLKNGGEEQDKAMTQFQVLLKAVLLRRTKNSKIDGKPILELPARITEKVHSVFSEDERQLYDALETQTQLQFNKYLKAGTVGRNYSNILVLLLRLRQACCHPHLMKDFSVEVNAETQDLDLTANAKKFSREVIVRLKDNDNLECPICIDAVDNPIIFFPCGHSACAECFSRMTDPAAGVMQGNDGAVEVKCPNCRAKIDPKKVTDRTCFRKVHYPEESGDVAEGDMPKVSPNDDDDDDESDDDSDDDSLSRFIADDDEDDSSYRRKKRKGKKASKPKMTLAELKKEASKNLASRRRYLRRLEKNWVTSAKIEKTMEILQEIRDGEKGEKTIIFSQFTSLLDLLEIPIMRKGWGYRRYDGSMRAGDRNTAVLDFTDNPNCKIMLVSLKAGNSGLNLVAASQVIIFDPFWNPYIEEQAIDRAHRIGQTKDVHIHRILVEKTVEDRILELQEKKRELIEGALDENAGKNLSRLGTRELAYLFGVN